MVRAMSVPLPVDTELAEFNATLDVIFSPLFLQGLSWMDQAIPEDLPPRRPRQRKPRPPVPDGLKTAAQAAARLGCSIKTLNGHIASGALRYVSIGHGTKRARRMFTDSDLDEFIADQTRKDVPCQSISTETAARRSGTLTSKCEVIGFTARRDARRGVKPKK
jgi:hypothetical protein